MPIQNPKSKIQNRYCPSVDELQRLAIGLISDEAAGPLERHLLECRECVERMGAVAADDTLLNALKAPSTVKENAAEENDVLRQLVSRLGDLSHVTLSTQLDLTGDEQAEQGVLPLPSGEGGLHQAAAPINPGTYAFLCPAESPDEIGRLGGYRVLRVLGSGGMGVVFEAEDPRLKRHVALKVMKPDLAARVQSRQRFLREAQAMAALDHDHIVTIYQVGEDAGVPFLAMQFLQGESLDSRLNREGSGFRVQGSGNADVAQPPSAVVAADAAVLPLPSGEGRGEGGLNQLVAGHREAERTSGATPPHPNPLPKGPKGEGTRAALPLDALTRIGREIAEGLAAAHERGLIHRDIKPGNIWLETTRGRTRVKILDFGLARVTEGAEELTHSAAVLGTPSYMAPEQARGEHVDARADLFSLGCVLYRMATGQAPFKGNSPLSVLMSLAVTTPPSPRDLNPNLPSDLNDVIVSLLSKDPASRPQSARDVADRLASVGNGLQEGSGDPEGTPVQGSGEDVAQRPSAVAAADAALLPLPSGEGRGEGILHQASPSTAQAGSSRRIPPRRLIAVALAFGAAALFAGIVIVIKNEKDEVIARLESKQEDVVVDHLAPGHKLIVQRNAETKRQTAETATSKTQDLSPKTSSSNPKSKIENPKSWHGWPADAPAPAIAPFDAAQAKKHQQEWADYLKLPLEYTNTIGMKFVLIPPGEFVMGSTNEEVEQALKQADPNDKHWQECIKSEAPSHKVTLTQPFYLAVNEVTQKEYEAVMGFNPSHFAKTGPDAKVADRLADIDTANHPVETVSWNDAAEFCAKLSRREDLTPHYFRAGRTVTPLKGSGYRLATEAEWEFACRAGTTTTFWSGDKDEDLIAAGWFGGNAGGRTHEVEELLGNPFGLFDMHGNVSEWLQDRWEPKCYERFAQNGAIDPGSPFSVGPERVMRGGFWFLSAFDCRSSARYTRTGNTGQDVGFRVALVVDSLRHGSLAAKADGPSTTAKTQDLRPKTSSSNPKSKIENPKSWHGWPGDAPAPAVAPFDAAQAKKHQQEWADYLKLPLEYTNSIGMKFVLIPPGEFMMGSTDQEIVEVLQQIAERTDWQKWPKSEAPQHQVVLTKPVYFSVYEATQKQYEIVIGKNPAILSLNGSESARVAGLETDNHPVEGVSWNDAAEFCANLSKQERLKPFYFRAEKTITRLQGMGYRLPSEAEWEFACRAGTTTKFWTGDDEASLTDTAWLQANSGGQTHAVGLLRPNAFGLYDIHGNAREWVQDAWQPSYFSRFTGVIAMDPNGAPPGVPERLQRGGDWTSSASWSRSSARTAYDPGERSWISGIRVALETDALRGKSLAAEPSNPQDPDRAAAEAVLKFGGQLEIEVEGRGSRISALPDLPNVPFQIVGVILNDRKGVDRALLSRLAKLDRPLQLLLNDSDVTDDALRALHGRRVNWLELSNTLVTGKGLEQIDPSALGVLDIAGSNVDDAALEVLRRFRGLHTLHVGRSQVTERGVANLAKLVGLSELVLRHVGDDELARVASLDRLTKLSFYSSSMTDAGFKFIEKMNGLRELALWETALNDSNLDRLQNLPSFSALKLIRPPDLSEGSLAAIARLKTLATLHVDSPKQPGTASAVIRHVSGHDGLQNLSLDAANLTDDAVAGIGSIKNLQSLVLAHNPLTDAAIKHLHGLSKLSSLNLEGTKVTSVGIAELQAALPNCKIVSDEPQAPPRAADPNAEVFNWVKQVGGRSSFDEGTPRPMDSLSDLQSVADEPYDGRSWWHIGLLGQAIGDHDVKRFRSVTKPLSLSLHGTKITDAGLAELNGLATLRTLDLSRTSITSAGLTNLGVLPNLSAMNLAGTSVSNDDLAVLAQFPKLDGIELGGPQLTARAAAALSTHPRLTGITLYGGEFDDAAVDHLKKLTSLKYLKFHEVPIGDAGLARLPTAMPQIAVLELKGTRVTDACFAGISKLTELREFILSRQDITDDGLKQLRALTNLMDLQVNGTRVTSAGIAELQAALPNCKIDWTPTLPPTTGDPNRDAAEWVLATGGALSVQDRDGSIKFVQKASDLPALPWNPTEVWLCEVSLHGAGFRDDDLRRLALTPLHRVNINGARLSGAAMTHLRAFAFINIANTPIGDAGIAALEEPPRLGALWLSSAGITDAGLKRIGEMRRLESLYLRDNIDITDKGLAHLQRLYYLRGLVLAGTGVTDAGVALLAPLKQLRELGLEHTLISDRGLDAVAELSGLEELRLASTRITDDGLASLGKLKKLKKLNLAYNAITDVGMPEIAKLTTLEMLTVGVTRVGDTGAEKLAGLKKLRELWLDRTEITDDGLKHLHGLTNLERLYVQNTQVTAAGVAEVQSALPNCKIVWSDPASPPPASAP